MEKEGGEGEKLKRERERERQKTRGESSRGLEGASDRTGQINSTPKTSWKH